MGSVLTRLPWRCLPPRIHQSLLNVFPLWKGGEDLGSASGLAEKLKPVPLILRPASERAADILHNDVEEGGVLDCGL